MDRASVPNILHVHGSFSLGGKEARAVQLMNFWGNKAHHSIVSAAPDAMSARDAIEPSVSVDFPEFSYLTGRPNLARFREISKFLRRFDLILTYNWGAMDAVMAHRYASLFGEMPPLIHHEDGFNADEANGLKVQRNIYRRAALGKARAVVVPSAGLKKIALNIWKQPEQKVHLIRNGIDVQRYMGPPILSELPGLKRSAGKILLVTLAGLRPVKNIPKLVRAVAPHKDAIQLVVIGEGPERESILAEAAQQGLDDIFLAGFHDRPWRFMGLFDIFALSSDSEQFPISLVEAMAAGLPVASTDVGDVRLMLSYENRPFVACDEQKLSDALGVLAADPELRATLGRANQQRAMHDFDETSMVEAYASLYGESLAMPNFLR